MLTNYKPLKEKAIANLVERYNRSNAHWLTDVYGKPSYAKRASYDRIIQRVANSVGLEFFCSHPVKIVSYNTFSYCVAYIDVTEYGELMLCLETPKYIYACPCPEGVL